MTLILATSATLVGCPEEETPPASETGTETTGDGDGDPASGDGDGDTTTGDGDGETEPSCGDGVVDDGEECDDGNDIDNDECNNACTSATCEDGVLNQGEYATDCGGPCDTCEGLMFISSTSVPGDFGGLAAADATCQSLAEDAGLDGVYMAWLSETDTAVADRLVHSPYAYVRVDGEIIANNWDDLIDSQINVPINLDETGQVRTDKFVYTGTWDDASAHPSFNCSDWTSTDGTGYSGNPASSGLGWSGGGNTVCSASARLYCVRQFDFVGDCGDGIVEGAEQCDDANADNTDGCLSSCEVPNNCAAIVAAGLAEGDGLYTIDPDGPGVGQDPVEVWCDMAQGGLTAALIINSVNEGTPVGDFGMDWVGVDALALDPATASGDMSGPVQSWLDLNTPFYNELYVSTYELGVEVYRSEAIRRDDLRIEFGEDGYLLWDDPNGYYWCGGQASFMDAGVGQVNQPEGAPNDCKNHGSIGSGWDFSEDGFNFNQGLLMCGIDGEAWMWAEYGGGSQYYYPNPGAAQVIWVGTSVCGDGIVGGTEDCDDQNGDDGDGCLSNCTIPQSCADWLAYDAASADGDYTVYYEGDLAKSWTLYCHDMAGTPTDYLALVELGPDQNFSQYTAGGSSPGTNVRTNYESLRIDPYSLEVDIDDRTFASSMGNLMHAGNAEVTEMSYAVAMGCNGGANGLANIDLSGTPLTVDDPTCLGGFNPVGSVDISPDAKVVNLTAGGACGWRSPAPCGGSPHLGVTGLGLNLAYDMP